MIMLPIRALGATQRVLIIALLVPALLLVTVSALPALMIMPFLPNGTDHVIKLLHTHITYAHVLLVGSRSGSGSPQSLRELCRSPDVSIVFRGHQRGGPT